MAAQRVEVGRAAVVLIDEARRAVADDERRVAAGSVGDARLDMDGDREPPEVELLAVDGADEVAEPELAHRAVELPARVAGQQHADVAWQVVAQPRLVPVVAVEVRDVEVVGGFDAGEQVVVETVVAGEGEPRTEERRLEPRVAQHRAVGGLDQDPGMTDRGGKHVLERESAIVSGQATGGSVYCWPARETCSVHAEPSQ